MARQPVELGDTFCKAGSPSIVWIVDRFKLSTGLQHVELLRLDDLTTRITISMDALTNTRLFVRSAVEPG